MEKRNVGNFLEKKFLLNLGKAAQREHDYAARAHQWNWQ